MKVGTDGVLLGAWVPCKDSESQERKVIRILDVGTGSGLIALMLAQRCPNAQIDAIDIDVCSVEQARFNIERSPWKERIFVWQQSLQDLAKEKEHTYDLIVSNPPYFINSLKNPDKQRQTARHTDSLSYHELVDCAARLLSREGLFAIILPAEAEGMILSEAMDVGLSPTRLTHVYSKHGKPMKRVLAAFNKGIGGCEAEDLFIESETSPRSEEYSKLTEDFYL